MTIQTKEPGAENDPVDATSEQLAEIREDLSVPSTDEMNAAIAAALSGSSSLTSVGTLTSLNMDGAISADSGEIELTGIVNVSGKIAVGPVPPTTFEYDFASSAVWSNYHGHYTFADKSVATFDSPPAIVYGHACFATGFRCEGDQPLDHLHDFQAYQVYNGSGAVGRVSSFWALFEHNGSGTVAEMSLFSANNPTGTGPITNLYGHKIEPLTRGTNNWGYYSSGTMPHYLNGKVGIGMLPSGSSLLQVGGRIESVNAQGTDGVCFLTISGKANMAYGFNDSGSTNAFGVPDDAAYIGCLQNYPLYLLGGNGVLGVWDATSFRPNKSIAIQGAGNGLRIPAGSNAKVGTATLVGGTVTVANTSVETDSVIVPIVTTPGGTRGHLSVSNSAGASFTVTSTSATETSTFNWVIFDRS